MNGRHAVAAIEAIRRRKRASAVVVQVALGVGYRYAVAILDALTASGMLGPDRPDGTRAICACRFDHRPAEPTLEVGQVVTVFRVVTPECPVHYSEPTRDDF